jgi:hypothetical protein
MAARHELHTALGAANLPRHNDSYSQPGSAEANFTDPDLPGWYCRVDYVLGFDPAGDWRMREVDPNNSEITIEAHPTAAAAIARAEALMEARRLIEGI